MTTKDKVTLAIAIPLCLVGIVIMAMLKPKPTPAPFVEDPVRIKGTSELLQPLLNDGVFTRVSINQGTVEAVCGPAWYRTDFAGRQLATAVAGRWGDARGTSGHVYCLDRATNKRIARYSPSNGLKIY